MKKILAWLLVVSLSATAAVGGTLAYLQSQDEAVNVMTLGNVEIEQIEQERNESGNLVDFTQNKPVYPAVYEGSSIPWADAAEWPVPNDEAWKVVAANPNVVDKFVTVKNTGRSDAYVRTLIAFEVGKDAVNDPYMHLVCNDNSAVSMEWPTENGEPIVIEVDGGYYMIGVFTYAEPLAPEATTIPSIKQVYLDKTATNEVCEAYGDTFEILALSQAGQVNGFEDVGAAAALDTMFGVVNAENASKWFRSVKDVLISSADEAYDSTLTSGSYKLGADFKTSESDKSYSANRAYAIRDDKEYTLDLNGHTITYDTVYDGFTYLYTVAYNSTLTINGNGTIISTNGADHPSEENCIVYAQSTGNVVINGGNFNPENGVAAWAGTGAHITINGGSFVSTGEKQCELIYSSGGVIDIYGGFFHNTAWEGRPVNIGDANRGTGFINIYGGTFVNFDPSTGGNDPGNINVMDGYKVVSEAQANGDVWYTVVPA